MVKACAECCSNKVIVIYCLLSDCLLAVTSSSGIDVTAPRSPTIPVSCMFQPFFHNSSYVIVGSAACQGIAADSIYTKNNEIMKWVNNRKLLGFCVTVHIICHLRENSFRELNCTSRPREYSHNAKKQSIKLNKFILVLNTQRHARKKPSDLNWKIANIGTQWHMKHFW